MSDLTSIGANAVQVYQRALGTVSTNIANLDNEAYVRRSTDVAESAPKNVAGNFLGTGSFFDGVRREYDAFLEASVRDSAGALGAEQSMVKYAGRVVDSISNQENNLSTGFEAFFVAARGLTADPDSSTLRSRVMLEASALVSQFRDLDGFVQDADRESADELDEVISEVNGLAAQLSGVNAELNKQIRLKKQSPQLLDQRDDILRKLAELVPTEVQIDKKGLATVSLNGTSTSGFLVRGIEHATASLQVGDDGIERLALVLDTDEEVLARTDTGKLGGILEFRRTTLQTAYQDIDRLASSFVIAVNDVQAMGLDADGDIGEDLFAFDLELDVEQPANIQKVTPTAEIVDGNQLQLNPLEAIFNEDLGKWTVTDLRTGQSTLASNSGVAEINGIELQIPIETSPQATLNITFSSRAASTIKLTTEDGDRIATSGLFRAITDQTNLSEFEVDLDYLGVPESVSTADRPSLVDAFSPQYTEAGFQEIGSSTLNAAYTIPAGVAEFALFQSASSEANVQVFTRDGRLILGEEPASPEDLITTASGFVEEATYSAEYRNQDGVSGAYRDWPVFYGARATRFEQTVPTFGLNSQSKQYEENGMLQVDDDPVITGGRVSQTVNPGTAALEVIAEDALSLQGESLGALTLQAGETLTAAKVADWLNTEINDLGITGIREVQATSRIEVPINALSLKSPGNTLSINGELINAGSPITTVDDLITQVNATFDVTNVSARLSDRNTVVLWHRSGGNIEVGPATNVLGSGATYSGTISIQGEALTDTVSLEISQNGSAADLAVLGLDTQLEITDTIDEELLVFVTGESGKQAFVEASYRLDTEYNPKQALREQPLAVAFIEPDPSDPDELYRYQIVDQTTSTVVAERAWSEGDPIEYQGLRAELSQPPEVGDRFEIDGNNTGVSGAFDAQGNNENILRLAELQTDETVMGTGQTFQEFAGGFVARQGSALIQAELSELSLKGVHEQAVASRDAVSGVSLDQEAADLVRFQQAYQASAQILQASNKLFDSILAIR